MKIFVLQRNKKSINLHRSYKKLRKSVSKKKVENWGNINDKKNDYV